jgi:hypothetical protein
MTVSLQYVTLVAFATTAPYAIGAYAQSTAASQPSQSTSALVAHSPENWIEYDDNTLTPSSIESAAIWQLRAGPLRGRKTKKPLRNYDWWLPN